MRSRRHNSLGPLWHGSTSTLVLALGTALLVGTASAGVPEQVTNIFKPLSTPAELISEVAWLALTVCAGIFLGGGGLLAYTTVRTRACCCASSCPSRTISPGGWRRSNKPTVAEARVHAGRDVFFATSCVNCHTISGTTAQGKFGPDLTHLMSRDTLAAGTAPNTPATLRSWVRDPHTLKEGALMPNMQLSDTELDQIVAYLLTLK